jgi:putative transposase
LIAQAAQAELEEYLTSLAGQSGEWGRSVAVRNGCRTERTMLTEVGPIPVRVPTVRSPTDASARFLSGLVPTYVHRVRSIDSASAISMECNW